MTGPEQLPDLDDDSAVREVGWVAREARRLIEERPMPPAAEWAAFYDRKARLLRFIASRPGVIDPDAAAQLIARAEAMAAAYRVDVGPLSAAAPSLFVDEHLDDDEDDWQRRQW